MCRGLVLSFMVLAFGCSKTEAPPPTTTEALPTIRSNTSKETKASRPKSSKGTKPSGTDPESLLAYARENPYEYEAWVAVDRALARKGRIPEILDVWNEFLDLNSDYGPAYLERAGVHVVMRNWPEARADIDEACSRGNAKGCELKGLIKDFEDEARAAQEIDKVLKSGSHLQGAKPLSAPPAAARVEEPEEEEPEPQPKPSRSRNRPEVREAEADEVDLGEEAEDPTEEIP